MVWTLLGVIVVGIESSIEIFGGGRISAVSAIFPTAGMLVILLQTSLDIARGFGRDGFVANELLEFGARSRVFVGKMLGCGCIGVINASIQMLASVGLFSLVLVFSQSIGLNGNVDFDFVKIVLAIVLFALSGFLVGMIGGSFAFVLRSSAVSVLAVLVAYLGLEPIVMGLVASWEMPMVLSYLAPSAAVDGVMLLSAESVAATSSLIGWVGVGAVFGWLSFRLYKP